MVAAVIGSFYDTNVRVRFPDQLGFNEFCDSIKSQRNGTIDSWAGAAAPLLWTSGLQERLYPGF